MDPAIQAAIDAAVQIVEANLQQKLQQTQPELQQAQQDLQDILALPPPAPVVMAAPQAPPRVAVFAYSPATTVVAAALINYDTANGAKIQKTAVEKLHVEHDLDKANLHEFLEALQSRSIACGWNYTLLTIMVNGVPLNMIDSYGTIEQTSTKEHVLT
jgi:hypothetical protein